MNENLVYSTSTEFVESFLSVVYQRQVSDLVDTAWCPEWFEHADAAERLEAVWKAWEYLRQDGATGTSVWLLDHADRHMRQLTDRHGTFRHCSARAGHRETLRPLPNTKPPVGLFDGPERQSGDAAPTRYVNVAEFVEEYLRLVYQGQVTERGDTVWCPEWWSHPEAVVRLDAMWRVWEYLHPGGGIGVSVWFIDHADRHMSRLLSRSGPFRYCGTRSGHRDLLHPLPLHSPPPGLFDTPEPVDGGGLVYANVGEFVERYLSPVYRRHVDDPTDTRWCPQWWLHPEAFMRFEALHRSWEYLRYNGATGMSDWFLDHADPHMSELLDRRGPFKHCSVRNGHHDAAGLRPVRSPHPGTFRVPSDEDQR